MFTVYILENSSSNKHYIGSTNNIERRLVEHNKGSNTSTHRHGLWRIIYSETYDSSKEAKAREKQIKSYKGGNAFKRLIHGI